MTKRARSPYARRAGPVSAHPIRVLAALPPLHLLRADVTPDDAAPRPEGTATAHAHAAAALRFSPGPFAAGFVDGASGELYVAEPALYFWDAAKCMGFGVPYEKIAIHAVSRGSEAADGKEAEPGCLYIQLLGSDAVDEDGNVVQAANAGAGNSETDEEGEEKDPRYEDDEDEIEDAEEEEDDDHGG